MTNQDLSNDDSMPVNETLQALHKRQMSSDQRVELDRLFSAAYDELKRLAISSKRSRVNPAVSTGTLINEAWLRLASAGRFESESKEHFINIAAKVMRHILIEAARRKNTFKRGDGMISTPVTFNPDSFPISSDEDLLALDAALHELELLDPRQARIVEEKFFGGFEMVEIAQRLKISLSTVTRDWRVAKARLGAALHSRG